MGVLTDPRVSACMVLYHSGEDALRAARCVRESNVPVTLYAVDNAPEDGTADALRRQDPDVTILTMKKNVGYGAANTETGVDFWFELEKDQQSNH